MKKSVDISLLPFDVAECAVEIGRFVRAMRVVRKFTMADVAAKSEVSVRTLSDIENGKPGVQMVHVLNALWAVDGLRTLRESLRIEQDELFIDKAKSALRQRVRS